MQLSNSQWGPQARLAGAPLGQWGRGTAQGFAREDWLAWRRSLGPPVERLQERRKPQGEEA